MAVIIAVVEAVKRKYPAVTGLLTVLLAAVLGVLAGYLGLLDLTVQSGLLAGLSAVGVSTVAGKVSGK